MQRMWSMATLCFAIATLSLPPGPAAAQAQQLVLLQRTVNTKYDPSSEHTHALLKSSLAKKYVVKPGDGPEKILSEQFGVGRTVAPDVYKALTRKIETLNDLPNLNGLQPGQPLAIPDLPLYQSKMPAPGNRYYGLPRTELGPTYAEAARSADEMPLARLNQILAPNRLAEPLVNQRRWVTIDQAKEEFAAAGDSVDVKLWSQSIIVRLADANDGHASAGVGGDIEFVSALVKKRKPSQDVVLFILDDSWPSDDAFNSSREFIVKATDTVRQKYLLGSNTLGPALRSSAAKTDFPIRARGNTAHAELVSGSLADFSKLSDRVKVVYLPLFTEQKWAFEIWRELAQLTMTADVLRDKLGEFGPTPDIVQKAAVDARDLVAQIPSKAIDDVGPAQQTPVTALSKFAQLYAQATGMPFFISFSWTVEKYEIPFGPDADSLGVTLAATGNDKKDVIQDNVYLAYRGKSAPGDVVAVMNTDNAGGVLCSSGTLPLDAGTKFYGLAYDGRFVTDPAKCGTSFSTPRVAWMLALREAYNAPIPAAARPNWYGNYRDKLITLQDASKADSGRYWLSVSRLFAGL